MRTLWCCTTGPCPPRRRTRRARPSSLLSRCAYLRDSLPPALCPPLPFRDGPQVKSLALSEDGPVIRRSVSEPYYNFFPRQMGESSNRNVLAPDPLAMLSDGERTVGGERAIGGRGEPGGERAIGGRGEPVLAFRKHLPLPLLAGLRDERDLADDVDEHVERERGLGGARARARRARPRPSSSSGDVISRQMPSPA